MKRYFFICLVFFCLGAQLYKPVTLRQNAQYLSVQSSHVEDTCPGQNIFEQFSCSKEDSAGLTCFDVYRVQGDPIAKERYTLLEQTLTTVSVSAEPLCSFKELTCDKFLAQLNYNLDFSWFIANFPSSSFPECGQTYSCTRIACLIPLAQSTPQNPVSQQLSCVFKKNQTFFLGAEVTCKNKITR